jgi:hypothetical protein
VDQGRDSSVDQGRDSSVDQGRDSSVDQGRDSSVDQGRDSSWSKDDFVDPYDTLVARYIAFRRAGQQHAQLRNGCPGHSKHWMSAIMNMLYAS